MALETGKDWEIGKALEIYLVLEISTVYGFQTETVRTANELEEGPHEVQ